jgi:CxxC motif-containing protein
MKKQLICIACPIGCHLEVDIENDYTVTGNQCKRGETYGKKELINPTRIITSTVIIKNGIYKRIPVKTDGEIPKDMIFEVMKELNGIVVSSPIKCGEIVIKDVCNTGVNIVTSRSM